MIAPKHHEALKTASQPSASQCGGEVSSVAAKGFGSVAAKAFGRVAAKGFGRVAAKAFGVRVSELT